MIRPASILPVMLLALFFFPDGGWAGTYTDDKNVAVTINPLGQRWEYEYDARNRRTVERLPSVTKTEIDPQTGQPVEDELEHPVIETAFDGVGNVITVTDPRGHIVRSFHDNAYRVTGVLTNPVSGNPATTVTVPPAGTDILVQTNYDSNGNVLEVIDGNLNATRNTYDALNRLLTTTTNPDSGDPLADPPTGDITVTNAWDDAGNLVQVTDGEGRLTGFRHDGLGRKTRTLWDETSTVQRVEQATYDGAVQLARTDPENQTTAYQYDDLNRLVDIVYGTDHLENRQYNRDLAGNLLDVTYPEEPGSVRDCAQTFDKLDRLISETSAGAPHTHTYDKAGNRRTTAYAANGRLLASTYDHLNRLLTCTETAKTTTYAYDLNGNITRKTLPNGSHTHCTFDALNRKITEDTRTSTDALISSFDYSQNGYDKAGNVVHVVEQYGHFQVKNREVTNLYDHVYRLETETIDETGGPSTVTEYEHDDANNRTKKIVTVDLGPATTWTYQHGTLADTYNSNQLKSAFDGTTTTTFGYDANGNRTEKLIGGVPNQTYTWDHENRLTQVVDTTLGTFNYSYDHRTRRVLRDESGMAGGTADHISFAGGLSVQEYLGSATLPTVEYIRGSDYGGGIGGVLYTIRPQTGGGFLRSYNAYNSRGDVVSKTDDTETITWQASYEAFGKRTQDKGGTADRQKANTKDEDAWRALNEGMRYRDLEFGVFLSRDPAGFVDGPNVYTYVRQNPWTYYDPYGLNGFTDYMGEVGQTFAGIGVGFGKTVWGSAKGLGTMAYRGNPVVNGVQALGGNKTGYQKNWEEGTATLKGAYALATSSDARAAAGQAVGGYMDEATSSPYKMGEMLIGPGAAIAVEAAVGAKGADKIAKISKASNMVDEAASLGANSARVQHATSAEAAEQIMKTQRLGTGSSPGGATFSRVAKSSGKSPTKSDLRRLGVERPEKVIEFDVKKSELKMDELGDVRLPDPTDLKGRNVKELDVPEE